MLPFSIYSQGEADNPGHGDQVTLRFLQICINAHCYAFKQDRGLASSIAQQIGTDELVDDAYDGYAPMQLVADAISVFVADFATHQNRSSNELRQLASSHHYFGNELHNAFLKDIEFEKAKSKKHDSSPATSTPLWLDMYSQHEERVEGSLSNRLEDHMFAFFGDESETWSFWRDWYRSLLDGKALDWNLQFRVARIDDQIWNAGPEAVAREIARIQTEIALTDLPQAHIGKVTSRHGVGGNNPPEEIEDVQALTTSITLIWDAAAGIKEEVASDAPDQDRVAACLQALKTGLVAIVKWCGRKVDLTVDTLIKWGIPSGGAYLVTQPEKVEALIKAVEEWLKFLS